MLDLECPGRWSPARILGVVAFCVSTVFAQPVAVTPRWQVNFAAAPGGKPAESTAVAVDAESLLVAVLPAGADATAPVVKHGNRAVQATVVGHDPVSRLAFLKVDGDPGFKPVAWNAEVGANANSALQVLDAGVPAKCRTTGWVKQVGGKILPLALVGVDFNKAVPAPGTPLLDGQGKVAGIVFQGDGGGNSGYAIPAEAVHRVKQDICNGGHLNRGWIGLALRAEARTPQISRVLPDSPASAAGIQPNDVLLGVGARHISDYADAANAFFYLVPGKAVKVKLQRDAQQLEYSLVPVKK